MAKKPASKWSLDIKTEANGRLQIDPAYLENEVYPSYEAAGETALPPVSELLDATVMADAHRV